MRERLSGIAAFVQAVEAGSFAQAAERMQMTRSAVGKSIARLEERLGVRLFHRTTRRQSLTEDGQAILEGLNPMFSRLASLQCPTVAAVQGAALGVGLGLALACDLLVVAESAKIGSPFAAIGAVLDSGSHHFLCSRIGPARTLELVYTGRFLSGAEAVEWGIANQVHPDDELLGAARALVAAIAAGPTAAFLLSKDLVARIAGGGLSLDDVLAAEAAGQGAASRTHDYGEGITAFQEKRKPTFTGH